MSVATPGNNEKRGSRCPTSCQLVGASGRGRLTKPSTSWQLVGHFQKYPPIARAMNAEGAVRIHVTISEEGKVIEAVVIDGHPLLHDAALQAARQWEFTPTEFSGKLVKVVGILTFNFSLK